MFELKSRKNSDYNKNSRNHSEDGNWFDNFLIEAMIEENRYCLDKQFQEKHVIKNTEITIENNKRVLQMYIDRDNMLD